MKLENRSYELVFSDRLCAESIPALTDLIDKNQRSNGFFDAGNVVFVNEKNRITRRNNHLYMYSLYDREPGEYPASFGEMSSYPACSYFYFSLRFLPQHVITQLTDIVDMVVADAEKHISSKLLDVSLIQMHGLGQEFPLHAHSVRSNCRVLTYCVKLGNTESTASLSINGLSVPILRNTDINRLSFDPAIPHKVDVSPDDPALYMWITFDAITGFVKKDMYSDKESVLFWDIGKDLNV